MNAPFVRNYSLTRLTLTNANTEYSQVLNTTPFYLRIHGEDLAAQFKISFTALGSALGEIIFQGAEWFSPAAMVGANLTLYIQSPNAGVVVQIIQFSL